MGQAWLNLGIYEVPDAARFIGVPPARLRRWVSGTTVRSVGGGRELPPLWDTQLPRVEGRVGLSFLDLVQAKVLLGFTRNGLSVRALRRLIEHAQEVLQSSHPLAHARFRTDGKRLYLEVRSSDESIAYDLKKRQYAFHSIVSPTFRQLDFVEDMASRWWPLGKERTVVLDPKHSFGAPIVTPSRVPTASLFQEYLRLSSRHKVARWFEVSYREVADAVDFEQRVRPRPGRVPAAA